MTYGRTSSCLGDARETVKRKEGRVKEKERKGKKRRRRKRIKESKEGRCWWFDR